MKREKEGVSLIVYAITDQGLIRKDNQDFYGTWNKPEHVLGVVCDGMGGALGGSVASRMAVEVFMAELELADAAEPVYELNRALAVTNEDVRQRSMTDSECSGMGTTMVAAWVIDGHGYILNVGDSRGYLIRSSGITQITRDHSLVADLLAHGKITPEQARTHPNKNIITRAIGTDRKTQADVFEVELKAGDYILLCTDGLSNTVSDQELLYEVLYGGEDDTCCQRLLDIAIQRGAPDNVTAVLISTGGNENE